MATLSVRVKPGVRNPGIRVEADSVEVRVRAPAQEGRANEAVREALAAALGVAVSTVTLVRGGDTAESLRNSRAHPPGRAGATRRTGLGNHDVQEAGR